MAENLRHSAKLQAGKAIGAQKGLADTFNEIVDVLNRLEVDTPLKLDKLPFGKWVLGLESAINQNELNYINKLKIIDGEIWIYAPAGVPSLFYPGTLLVWSGSPFYPGALDWRVPAYVDPELARDGDWVNTGISLATDASGLIYARIDSGAVVKFSLDVPTDGDSSSAGVDPKPYIAIGSVASGKALNFVVGVQGISGGIFHDAVVEEGD